MEAQDRYVQTYRAYVLNGWCQFGTFNIYIDVGVITSNLCDENPLYVAVFFNNLWIPKIKISHLYFGDVEDTLFGKVPF